MRILLLTNKPPLPALLTGGGQRSDLLLRALAHSGEVDLLLVGPPGFCTEQDLAPVRARHRVVGRYPWTTKLWAGPWRFAAGWLPGVAGRAGEALARQTRRYSIEPALAASLRAIWAAGGYDVVIARPLEPLLRSGLLATGARIVLDVDDLESEVLQQRFDTGPHDLPRAIEASLIRRLRSIEAHTFDACAHVWLTSEDDRRRLALPHGTLLPNVPWRPEGHPPVSPRPARSDSLVVLFVGNLSYEPNSTGVARFVHEAWPHVRAAVPNATLRLVGPLPPPALAREWRQVAGIEVVGFVEDLATAYDAAALTIAPLTWGGGTCIKVLESLAYARPCVLTARTLRGFESFLRHGESVWCADDVPAMAEGCVALLRDSERRRAMAEQGRSAVEQHASMTRFTKIVSRTLATVVPSPALSPP